MKKRPFLSLGLLLLLAPCVSAQLIDRTDNQQWTDVQLAVPVTKQFDFNVLGTLRIGRDISHSVDERIGVGFTFKYGKYLTVSPNFLYIGMQPSPNRRIWESRLSLPVTLRWEMDKFKFSDRNTFERRIRNSGLKSMRYRNRLQIEHSLGEAKWNWSVYVADEEFYDSFVDRWGAQPLHRRGHQGFQQALHARLLLHATERRRQHPRGFKCNRDHLEV